MSTNITYGRVVLTPILPKNLKLYETMIVYRTSGPVRILEVKPTSIQYQYIGETDILRTSMHQGFALATAYLRELDEENWYLPIHQNSLVFLDDILKDKKTAKYNFDQINPKLKFEYSISEHFAIPQIPKNKGAKRKT